MEREKEKYWFNLTKDCKRRLKNRMKSMAKRGSIIGIKEEFIVDALKDYLESVDDFTDDEMNDERKGEKELSSFILPVDIMRKWNTKIRELRDKEILDSCGDNLMEEAIEIHLEIMGEERV